MKQQPVGLETQGFKEYDEKESLKAKNNQYNRIKKMYAIVSGKGGVGKSSVSALFADAANKKGYRTGLIDADITGPSIPKILGIHETLMATETELIPARSKGGIRFVSINLLLEDAGAPVLWRGPILGGVVKQFYEETIWSDVDFMFIDMPPGTGDVPLTVYQSLPIDGVIMVSSPQSLSGMIVEKAINMANTMEVPVMGIIENMSYFECRDTGKKHHIFGESHIDELANMFDLKVLAKLPIDPKLTELCDSSRLEEIEHNPISDIFDDLFKDDIAKL